MYLTKEHPAFVAHDAGFHISSGAERASHCLYFSLFLVELFQKENPPLWVCRQSGRSQCLWRSPEISLAPLGRASSRGALCGSRLDFLILQIQNEIRHSQLQAVVCLLWRYRRMTPWQDGEALYIAQSYSTRADQCSGRGIQCFVCNRL